MENLQNIIQTVRNMVLTDYLDILVVTFLLYKLLPLFQTPNIKRIANTVGALILITWITAEMDLHTINWILDQVLAIGLLAVVVLFQPELRRMLDHLGNVKLRSFFGVTKPVQEMELVISHVVNACEHMSRERVGALIVFAREHQLDEYYKTGTLIDGQVSDQLVRNIFFKNSPLHDGAMIIREGRVAAAACVLPLSDSHRISADLGTRHRAGLGMSEASDAVVVIVSEENGTISVAHDGMLKRYLAPQTLEKLLRNELCPAAPDPRSRTAVQMLKKITQKKEDDGYGEK